MYGNRLLFYGLVVFLTVSSCNINMKKPAPLLLPGEGIHAAFYDKDGTKIAMATTLGRLLLCSADLTILLAKQAHEGVTNSSFFSLNDSFIITGGADKKIQQWNATDLTLNYTYPYTLNSHTTVLGNTTMVGCGENGLALIYTKRTNDTATIKLSNTAAFHVYYNKPDTTVVVSAGDAGYEINVQEKKVTHAYVVSNGLVYCIMPDQTNTTVVLGCGDSTVRVFNRSTEQLLYQSAKLDGAVYVACYNYQNNTIAASTSTGSIYFFDTALKLVKNRIKAFDGCVNTIHYHPTDSFIVAGSLDKENGGAKLFSAYSGKLLKDLKH